MPRKKQAARLKRRQPDRAGGAYEQIYDGKWFVLSRPGFDLKCCDCGLVHEMMFRLQNGHIEIRMTRT